MQAGQPVQGNCAIYIFTPFNKAVLEHKKVIAWINAAETNYPVAGWRVGDIDVWPYIRIAVALKLYAYNPGAAPAKPIAVAKNVTTPSLAGRIRTRLADRRMDKCLYRGAETVFLSTPSCRTFFNGKWYNKYFDRQIHELEAGKHDTLLLEFKDGKDYLNPVFNPGACVQLESYFERQVWAVVPGSKQDVIALEAYESFVSELKETFPGIDFEFLQQDKLLQRMAWLGRMSAYFKSLLQRNKTKAVFLTCYYEIKAMALCHACHALSIPVTDMQHGLQGEHHAAYGSWLRMPERGYTLLPHIFWCWNASDAEMINRWAAQTNGKHTAFAGGNPWLDVWGDESQDFVKSYTAETNKISAANANGINILFAAQPVEDAFPAHLVEAVNASEPNCNWWIRLHPRQAGEAEKIKQVFAPDVRSRIFIAEPTLLPLPALLKAAQVHITQWSSVVLEAESMGVPSVVIHQNGADIFASQVNAGTAAVAFTAQEILDAISKQAALIINTPAQDAVNHFNRIIEGGFKAVTKHT